MLSEFVCAHCPLLTFCSGELWFFRLDLIARHIFERVNQPDYTVVAAAATLISKVNMQTIEYIAGSTAY